MYCEYHIDEISWTQKVTSDKTFGGDSTEYSYNVEVTQNRKIQNILSHFLPH